MVPLVRDDIIKASLLMFPAPRCGTGIMSSPCVCEADVDGFVFSYLLPRFRWEVQVLGKPW